MNSVQLFGLLILAGGLVWSVLLLARPTTRKQPAPLPLSEPKSALQTRLDALTALDSLLSYCVEAKNAKGIEAVQQAVAAIVQVKLDE